MHDLGGFAAILLAILAGAYFNNRGQDKLEARIDRLANRMDGLESRVNSGFDKIEARLDRMQSDLSQFYRDLGDHGARIEALEKRAK
jgi:uncharacterized membrane-anchored protein YhcB (DUF1043 family)